VLRTRGAWGLFGYRARNDLASVAARSCAPLSNAACTSSIAASAIVTATTNSVDNSIELGLAEAGVGFHLVGDAAAPRTAPFAFHEGRKIGLAI